MGDGGFEPPKALPADLQSVPFGHSGNPPYQIGAGGRIRTPDLLITNQLLWPTELHRQNQPFWIAKVGIKNLPAK